MTLTPSLDVRTGERGLTEVDPRRGGLAPRVVWADLGNRQVRGADAEAVPGRGPLDDVLRVLQREFAELDADLMDFDLEEGRSRTPFEDEFVVGHPSALGLGQTQGDVCQPFAREHEQIVLGPSGRDVESRASTGCVQGHVFLVEGDGESQMDLFHAHFVPLRRKFGRRAGLST
jgi:hypothetical protein